jgi:hypothetical protein
MSVACYAVLRGYLLLLCCVVLCCVVLCCVVLCCMVLCSVKLFHYRPLGLQEVEAPKIYIQLAHASVKVSPTRRSPLPHQQISS